MSKLSEFLITVRDDIREMECTTLFWDKTEEAAKSQSLLYYADELDRVPAELEIVSVFDMALV